jgi:hypothetical protein
MGMKMSASAQIDAAVSPQKKSGHGRKREPKRQWSTLAGYARDEQRRRGN